MIDVMQRYELKYILSKEQVEFLRKMLVNHMEVDEYGKTSIASLHYDTPYSRLIRDSIEDFGYKEKIRLRSYGLAKENGPVFLELKRKYDKVVYKRRIKSTENDVNAFFNRDEELCVNGQIAKEISYFRDYYKTLIPACLIIYDRVAYFEPNGDLRLTIDYNPRYRLHDLNLTTSMEGTSLLKEGEAILEIKVHGSIPLWLTHILDAGNIKKSSFSKYGTAYKQQIHCLQALA